MRLAFVDLLFTWPPHGGAVVDVYHTMLGLRALGHDVHLFALGEDGTPERGNFDPATLPFPATRIAIDRGGPDRIAADIRNAVSAWKPDVVFVCDGFFLKPFVALALQDFPLVARYYAYEMTCLRNTLQFKDGAPCPNDYFRTPDTCRRCALDYHRPAIQRGQHNTWLREFIETEAYATDYYEIALRAAQSYRAIIVYNDLQKSMLEGVNQNVFVVPGGVDPNVFAFTPPSPKGRKIVFMPGRAEDPVKGLDTLMRAADILDLQRDDFEIHVTHPDRSLSRDWFRALGWRSHSDLGALYTNADICVVPSEWEEPFGMVALEAMAVGRPVCASLVGGLQNIVVAGETGFLFERCNAQALAESLGRLLESRKMREDMGRAGRARVEAHYTWPKIVETHYPAILEAAQS